MEKIVKVKLALVKNVLSRVVPAQVEENGLMSGLDRAVKHSLKLHLPEYGVTVEQELIQDEQKIHPIYATMFFHCLDECRGHEAELAGTAVTEAVNRVLMAMINGRIREDRKIPGMIFARKPVE